MSGVMWLVLINVQELVLNAKRHQRYVQAKSERIAKRASSCSTPKGIKGMSGRWCFGSILGYGKVLNAKRHQRYVGHRRGDRFESGILVLNAKRHQRLGQLVALQELPLSGVCSTPKGIKGWDRQFRYP